MGRSVAELKAWAHAELTRRKLEALKTEASRSISDAYAGKRTIVTRPSSRMTSRGRTVAELGGLERIPGRIAARVTLREIARALIARHRLVKSGCGAKHIDDQLEAWGLRWRPPRERGV
jgi:hypothetical protein